MSPFGADQFDDSDEAEKKNKSSFFNRFYFSINMAALVASIVLVWVQTNVGWGLGLRYPCRGYGGGCRQFFFQYEVVPERETWRESPD